MGETRGSRRAVAMSMSQKGLEFKTKSQDWDQWWSRSRPGCQCEAVLTLGLCKCKVSP